MVSIGNDNHEVDGYLRQRTDTPGTPMGLAERIIERTKTMPQEQSAPRGVRGGVWSWPANVFDNIFGGLSVVPKPAFAFVSVAALALGVGLFSGQISVPENSAAQISVAAIANGNGGDVSTAFFYDPDFTIEEWL